MSGRHAAECIAILVGGMTASCALPGASTNLGDQRSIICTDPEDGSYLTILDDLVTATPDIDVLASCTTVGFYASEQVVLEVLSVATDTTATHTAEVDAGGMVSFGPIPLAFSVEDGPGGYLLVARGQGASSDPITVYVVDTFEADSGAYWEENCIHCATAADCDDGLTCTGREQCAYSEYRQTLCCMPNQVECTESDPCLVGRCDEALGGCVTEARDDDEDGHAPVSCGGLDCDDDSYAVHPGAMEICDGLDNDCDGLVDEGSLVPTGDIVDLGSGLGQPSSPSMAGGAASWGVAWTADDGSGPVVFAGVIEPDATAPQATVGELDPGTGQPSGVRIVRVGTGFAILVSRETPAGGSTVTVDLLDEDGTLAGSRDTVLTTSFAILDIEAAVNGATGQVGLFFRSDPTGDYDVFFHSFDPWAPGTATDVDVVPVSPSTGFSGHPSATDAAGGFAVAWEDDRDGDSEIWLAIVDMLGALSGPARRMTAAPGASEGPVLARSGDGFGLSWMDARGGAYSVLFTCLEADGARGCPDLGIAADGPSESWFPAIAADPVDGQYTIAFGGKAEDGTFDLFMTAASASGEGPLDPGFRLDAPSTAIAVSRIADVAGWRGVLWTSLDGSGAGSILFQEMACGG